MGRPPRRLPPSPAPTPAPLQAEDVLASVSEVLAPLVRLLLAAGVDYPSFAAAMKPVFAEEARRELLRGGRGATDSAISLLSGVHRKDLREWRRNGEPASKGKDVSLSSKLFARWLQDPDYRDRLKRPKALPRLGPAPSFESLARSVTQDVHPYTLLTELLRLGLVTTREVKGQEMVLPNRDGFVPAPGSRELLELFRDNLSDHAAAAASNVLGQAPRLEQSVFAGGLSAQSAAELGEVVRRIWARAREEMITEATRRYEADRGKEQARMRMRFGAYYWSQEVEPEAAEDAPGGETDNNEND